MNVLLSVRPRYVNAIMEGRKKYEFRKKIFKTNKIDFVFIYASSPVKKIVGYFKLGNIIIDHPKNLWNKLSDVSGLAENEFFEYFQNRDVGYAIDMNDFKMFKKPIDPMEFNPNFTPPQSFCYIHLIIKELDII